MDGLNLSSDVQTLLFIVCGVAFLILLAAIFLLQVVRGSIFGIAMMLMRTVTEPKEEPTVVNPQALPHNPSADVRALAEAVKADDIQFDAAVEKYRQQDAAAQTAEDAVVQPNPEVPDTPDLRPPIPHTGSPIQRRRGGLPWW